MKRIAILFIIAILALTSCSYIEDMNISEGRLLICDNGSYILISEGSPIVLSCQDESIFDGLTTGDLIRFYHDGVEESYPAHTGAKRIVVVEKGSMADIDENVAKQLCELGWLDYDSMCQKYMEAGYIINCEDPDVQTVRCQYKYADMSIDIFDGWEYEIEEYNESCQSIGINFRPVGEEGWIKLHCYTSAFAVCGTGLESKMDSIAGYNVNIGTYLGDESFSFITFTDVPGEYVVQNFVQSEWVSEYEEDIMAMLDTVVFSSQTVSVEKITDIAKSYVDKEYNDIWAYFDSFNGIWEISFYNNSSDNIKLILDAQGNLIE